VTVKDLRSQLISLESVSVSGWTVRTTMSNSASDTSYPRSPLSIPVVKDELLLFFAAEEMGGSGFVPMLTPFPADGCVCRACSMGRAHWGAGWTVIQILESGNLNFYNTLMDRTMTIYGVILTPTLADAEVSTVIGEQMVGHGIVLSGASYEMVPVPDVFSEKGDLFDVPAHSLVLIFGVEGRPEIQDLVASGATAVLGADLYRSASWLQFPNTAAAGWGVTPIDTAGTFGIDPVLAEDAPVTWQYWVLRPRVVSLEVL